MKTLELLPQSDIPRRIRKVTDDQLDRAAGELGIVINAKKIKANGVIGRFLEQQGVVAYATSKLMASETVLQDTIKQCRDLIDYGNLDVELKRDFVKLQVELCKALNESALNMVQINKSEPQQGPKSGQAVKPFALGAQVSPIQINISGSTVATEKKAE